MEQVVSASGPRKSGLDPETVLHHAQSPIDPVELARVLGAPHGALGRVLRKLVEAERMRWVWDEAQTRSLCLDARVPCPEGYVEGIQGARLRDKAEERARPDKPADGSQGEVERSVPAAAHPPANDAGAAPTPRARPTTDSASAAEPPADAETAVRDLVRQAGAVRRPALARAASARARIPRTEVDAIIDQLIARGELVDDGGAGQIRPAATQTPPTPTQPADATLGGTDGDAPAAADAPERRIRWAPPVLDALAAIGPARRDQLEALARAPGVGGPGRGVMSAADELARAGLAAADAEGFWRVTEHGAGHADARAGTAVAPERLDRVRRQPDLGTRAHEAILAAPQRLNANVKLRDIADATDLDVRALLHAARDLEAVDALELSQDRRAPLAVSVRSIWRSARLRGRERSAPGGAPTVLDATAGRALIALTALGYATAEDLDLRAVRRRWDVAGRGADDVLAQLRDAALVHGPDRQRRWFPTDAGAAAEAEAALVLGRYRPEALARGL